MNEEQKRALANFILESLNITELSDEKKAELMKIDPDYYNNYLQEREQTKKEVASTLFDYRTKENKMILFSHDKITKQLPRKTDPEISLNDKKGKSRAVVCMDLLNENGDFLTVPLNYFELATLQAVYSLIDAGNDRFTGAQIYRKMRGGARVNPTQEALNELDKTLLKLKSTNLQIECVDEAGKVSKEAIRILGHKKTRGALLDFRSYEIIVNGQRGWGYELLGRAEENGEIDYKPAFYKVIKTIGQWQSIPDELLNIKKLNPKTGQLAKVQLNAEKIAISKYLLDFVLTFNHSNGNITNKRTYEQIFEACKVNVDHREKRKRSTEFIKIVLEHFKTNGLISEFNEYNNGRGVEIKTNKKS